MNSPVPSALEIMLDDATPGRERLRWFRAPRAVVTADRPADIAAALEALEHARRAGHYVAGYFSYEMGYALEPKLLPLLPDRRNVPLLWFGIFDACEDRTGDDARTLLQERVRGRAYAGPLTPEWDARAYADTFSQAHRLIGAGDIYQVNLSFRSRFTAVGDPMALYLALRENSAAAHGAFVADGTRHILSLSPELFFSISHDGKITARPMKGTAPRDTDPSKDNALRTHLAASTKDRAENLMIVDLLRNDLGRIAQIGTVSVSDLFAVETYPTLHTMVSTVKAQLPANVPVREVVRALFPCGSVTGAPKVRAMEVIRELEESARGVYCGAVGVFSPDGSADFNVAIRTITLTNGKGELGVGGAVVHDSRARAEYEECLLKARYFELARKPLQLIETLRYAPAEGFARLDRHLSRMEISARTFGIAFDGAMARQALHGAVMNAPQPLRVRLTLDEAGRFDCTAVPLSPEMPSLWTYAICTKPVSSGDVLLRHKTTWREFYDAEIAGHPGCDEVLFVNEHGLLTEGARTNIFVRKGGKLLTPHVRAGLLPGCLRQELIENGLCDEADLSVSDLAKADLVCLGNSLRGLIEAKAI